MNPIGFVLPAASLGVGALLLRPRRGFFPSADQGPVEPIVAQATIEEVHTDEVEITEHPVEQGTTISDHAFKRPERVIIRCGWSNSPSGPSGLVSQAVSLGATLVSPLVGLVTAVGQTATAVQSILTGNSVDQVRDTYRRLRELQASRVPFDILTGKRAYSSMLFESIVVETTEKTENSLIVTAVCKQVIIVTVQTVSVPINTQAQAMPEKTTPTQNSGTLQLAPALNYKGPQ